MPRLRYTTFDGTVHVHELTPGTFRIGRTADNELQIDELELSSRHCEIRFENEIVEVRDLDSVAGTFIDGQPVSGTSIVRPGQIISLGTFLVALEDSPLGGSHRPEKEHLPVPLADGSYSCLRHHEARAAYECETCFALACDRCATVKVDSAGSRSVTCNSCGGQCRTIDWSGLNLTTKDVLKDLFVPKKVKQALDLWNRHKDKLKP